MSAGILKKILLETEKQLEKSKTWRKYSDLKAHSVSIYWVDIRRELKKELGFIKADGTASFQEYIDIRNTGGEELKRLNDIISEEAKEIARATREGAEQDRRAFQKDSRNKRRKYPSYVNIEGTPLNFVLTLFVSKNDINPISIWGGKKEIAGSVFSTARSYYNRRAKAAEKNINAALGRAQSKKGPKVNLAHAEDNSIAQQRISLNQSYFAEKVTKANEKEPVITSRDLQTLGLTVDFEKLSSLQRDIINVGIGSEKENQRQGRKIQKEDLGEWRKLLKGAILKIDSKEALADRPGSDSRVTVEKKKVLKNIKKKFNNKKLKVKTENTTIKQTPKAKTSKKLKPKVATGTKKAVVGVGVSKAKKLKGNNSANSSIALASLVNSKLPATVAKNMGYPALENRSGKFAASVRVTEVLQTRQGFPSIYLPKESLSNI